MIGTEAGVVQSALYPDVLSAGDSPSEKALELLRIALPPATWSAFIKTGVIEFTGRRGTYLISYNAQTKIYDIRARHCRAYACLQLSTSAPDYDRMLAEYLVLKNDEDRYWRTANIFGPASDVAVFFFTIVDLRLLVDLFHLFFK